MYTFDYQKRVRYGETDQMGYLYYGQYAQYYEIGRVEMMRSLGIRYKELEEVHHVMMPVVSLQMRFVRPAYYDEMLTIRTSVRKMPDKFITFEVEIRNEKGAMVNGGSVRLCFVDIKTQQTISVPEYIKEKLIPYFA